MKHNIRQHVINQYGLPVTKIETVHGELGSDVYDKNGVEICEGDIVKYFDYTGKVTFEHGSFHFCGCLLANYDHNLEVVGHAED